MRRFLAAATAVFVVITVSSSALAWQVMTHWQRSYLTPELEAEIAAGVPHAMLRGREVPILRVAVMLPNQRGQFEWYVLPPEAVRKELQGVYPIPLGALAERALALAAAQTIVLLAALYTALRAAVRTARQQAGAPIQMPGSRP